MLNVRVGVFLLPNTGVPVESVSAHKHCYSLQVVSLNCDSVFCLLLNSGKWECSNFQVDCKHLMRKVEAWPFCCSDDLPVHSEDLIIKYHRKSSEEFLSCRSVNIRQWSKNLSCSDKNMLQLYMAAYRGGNLVDHRSKFFQISMCMKPSSWDSAPDLKQYISKKWFRRIWCLTETFWPKLFLCQHSDHVCYFGLSVWYKSGPVLGTVSWSDPDLVWRVLLDRY